MEIDQIERHEPDADQNTNHSSEKLHNKIELPKIDIMRPLYLTTKEDSNESQRVYKIV